MSQTALKPAVYPFSCTRCHYDKTKTIQCGQRVLEIPLPWIMNSPYCPAGALLLSKKLVPHDTSYCPAFIFRLDNKVFPRTYSSFLTRLKPSLTTLGIDHSNYSGHSFCRGGTSFVLECDLIQAQGEWASNAYKAYLDPSLAHRQKVMSTFATAFSSISFSKF